MAEEARPAITLGRNTSIGLSIGMIVALCMGVAAFVRSDTILRAKLQTLQETQVRIVEQNALMQSELEKIKWNMEMSNTDRWTRTDMRAWAHALEERNEGLDVPLPDNF